ncbi:hypothetical protein T484DRAFT_3111601 [Baffinella frigidus]|nr:hypothetical protein T484DRAFT_3111601 [Cryptophyta sp. CCMP2293]
MAENDAAGGAVAEDSAAWGGAAQDGAAGGRASQGAGATGASSEEVQALLAQWDLQCHAVVFAELGLEKVSDLKYLHDSDAEQLPIPTLARRKVQAMLEWWRKEHDAEPPQKKVTLEAASGEEGGAASGGGKGGEGKAAASAAGKQFQCNAVLEAASRCWRAFLSGPYAASGGGVARGAADSAGGVNPIKAEQEEAAKLKTEMKQASYGSMSGMKAAQETSRSQPLAGSKRAKALNSEAPSTPAKRHKTGQRCCAWTSRSRGAACRRTAASPRATWPASPRVTWPAPSARVGKTSARLRMGRTSMILHPTLPRSYSTNCAPPVSRAGRRARAQGRTTPGTSKGGMALSSSAGSFFLPAGRRSTTGRAASGGGRPRCRNCMKTSKCMQPEAGGGREEAPRAGGGMDRRSPGAVWGGSRRARSTGAAIRCLTGWAARRRERGGRVASRRRGTLRAGTAPKSTSRG